MTDGGRKLKIANRKRHEIHRNRHLRANNLRQLGFGDYYSSVLPGQWKITPMWYYDARLQFRVCEKKGKKNRMLWFREGATNSTFNWDEVIFHCESKLHKGNTIHAFSHV